MIDTKKSREIRAAGTGGEWVVRTWHRVECGLFYVADCFGFHHTSANTKLIAHAVNQLVPMCNEIDELRAALRQANRVANMGCGFCMSDSSELSRELETMRANFAKLLGEK